MKLFYSKGACSLAPHIALCELNMVYEVEAVDLKAKTCASGDYRKINPKGSVPALRMENGEILTEAQVILRYLADQKPEAGLIPKFGTLERYRCEEWMNYISTEVHKSFTPLFATPLYVQSDAAKSELKTSLVKLLTTKIGFISEKMGTNEFLMGSKMTVADLYLFNVLSWGQYVNVDISQWSNIAGFMKRMMEQPSVQKAMKEEGII